MVELRHDEKEVGKIKVFGCTAWAVRENAGKLDSRAEKCVMMGYEPGTKDGYRLWSLQRKRMIVRRTVNYRKMFFHLSIMIL